MDQDRRVQGADARRSCSRADFLKDNYLSTELRVPSTLMQTNICSPLATNAIAGNIWDNFSSQSYKELPSVGSVKLRQSVHRRGVRLHAARRRARLHAAGIARQPLVHGAVPAEQLGRPVRSGARRSTRACRCSRPRSSRCSGRSGARRTSSSRDLKIEGPGVGWIQRTTDGQPHSRVPKGYVPDWPAAAARGQPAPVPEFFRDGEVFDRADPEGHAGQPAHEHGPLGADLPQDRAKGHIARSWSTCSSTIMDGAEARQRPVRRPQHRSRRCSGSASAPTT